MCAKNLAYFVLPVLILCSCSVQKRIYLKGFYLENVFAKSKALKMIPRPAHDVSLQNVRGIVSAEDNGALEKVSLMASTDASNKGIILTKNKSYFHSVFPKRENSFHDSLKHEIP